MSDENPRIRYCIHGMDKLACDICKPPSELAPARGSAARELARELAERIGDAEDNNPYPCMSIDQMTNVIESFLKARGLVPLNAEVSDAGNQDAHNANARRSPHSLQ